MLTMARHLVAAAKLDIEARFYTINEALSLLNDHQKG